MQLDLEFPKINVNILNEKAELIYSFNSYFSIPRLDEIEYYDHKSDIKTNKHYGRVKYKVIKYSANLDDNYPEIYITVDTNKNLLDYETGIL